MTFPFSLIKNISVGNDKCLSNYENIRTQLFNLKTLLHLISDNNAFTLIVIDIVKEFCYNFR